MVLKWVNDKGDTFDFLTQTQCLDVEGLDLEMEINTKSVAGYNGSTFVSSSMPERQILLMLKLKDKEFSTKEQLLNALGLKGTLYVRDRKIYCHVNTIEYVYKWEDQRSVQLALIAPDPFFYLANETEQLIAGVLPLWQFPHTFDGEFVFGEFSDSVIGNFVNTSSFYIYPIVEFTAITSVTNPAILNINTFEKMKVNVLLSAGDKLIIDTRTGYKTIQRLSGDIESDVFRYIDKDFVFFGLASGDNYLKYEADVNAGGLSVKLKWNDVEGAQ